MTRAKKSKFMGILFIVGAVIVGAMNSSTVMGYVTKGKDFITNLTKS